MLKKLILVGLTATAMVLTVATTQGQAEPMEVAAEDVAAVYEHRSEYMKGLGKGMKAFSNYLKRGDGEPLELGVIAETIAETAGRIPDLFPLNTGLAENEESEAKANIWTEWDDFVKAANNLAPLASNLAAAFEGGDPAAIGAAVKALGGDGCRVCHKQFREKKE